MAILSKIRERSMFLIVIIGLALFAFVASPKDILDFFNSSKVDSVGEINGESISRRDFAAQVEAYKSNVGQNVSETQAVNAVWNNVLSEKIFKTQLEEAGIVVGEKDIYDAIIEIPSIKNAEIFKNEIGLFDEEKFKSYLANLKSSSEAQSNNAWLNWLQTERSVKANLEKSAYTQLVRYGVGASLKEGERAYKEGQTKLNGSYVYVPYSSIKDEEVEVSASEVEAYVNAHKEQFSTEEARDIKYVSFDIKASQADEEALKDDLNYIVPAFVKTENISEFIEDQGTDISNDDKFLFKNNLPTVVAEEIFSGNKGNVVGPYKFQNHLRLSKIVEFKNMPDSVQASHILVSYVGSRSANTEVTRSEDQAKKLADSILNVVKKRPSKFAVLAKSVSADKSNSEKGGVLDWFTYNQMVPEFRDYAFQNKKGSVGIVKTIFGYHVIKITDQKNIQKAVKLATIAKKIEASEETENTIFEQAEQLAYDITNGGSIDDLAKEKNFIVRPLVGLKAMEDAVAGLGTNRGIVRWTFDEETSVNSVRRFDLEKGYAVVVLTNKTAKGLTSASAASAKVKPILIKEKKAALIAAKMNGSDLNAIATANSTEVKTFSNVTMAAPTLSGVGIEPGVVGAIYASNVDKLVSNVVGVKGVFAIKVSKKEVPAELPSYEGSRTSLAKQNQGKLSRELFNSLKELAEIEDNRAYIY
ncbi:peptidylprolyl isomerase [Flavicella sp.]|uniref:peptidylprolyl isomerase n=1 Tax=Flavicella sp. TaxID=2957742 RepID=UPI00262D4790|nr:peptidylprolyl isomerase [Flavicella sp.]MDG1804464.1 peptidylprolyl isomerase [Flavicella sp.]